MGNKLILLLKEICGVGDEVGVKVVIDGEDGGMCIVGLGGIMSREGDLKVLVEGVGNG